MHATYEDARSGEAGIRTKGSGTIIKKGADMGARCGGAFISEVNKKSFPTFIDDSFFVEMLEMMAPPILAPACAAAQQGGRRSG
eukprot:scaffold52959_cov59-Phaeocystis_antarctica.AAC.9